MWINLSQEEIDMITETLKHCGLHAFNFNIRTKLIDFSLDNPRLTNKNAYEAARTYFAADDLIFEDDYVKWTDDGALVMCWQKVPLDFIENEQDCGCNK